MGLSDREYYRDESPGSFFGSRTLVTNLILLNVAVFVVDQFTAETAGGARWLSDFFSLPVGVLARPWEGWRLLTYGFTHAPQTISHVGWNMLGLWFFGRDLEQRYGPAEFARIYFTALFCAAGAWVAVTFLNSGVGFGELYAGTVREPHLIGASGAVAAAAVLYGMNFPHRTILLMFVIPCPAWLAAILFVLIDLVGFRHELASGSGVAYSAHLGGAALAALYFYRHWYFGRWWPQFRGLQNLGGRLQTWNQQRGRPPLKVHRPDEEPAAVVNEPTPVADEAEVDRILEKLHQQGQASLTALERRTLEEASRRYQRRKR